MTVSSSSSMMSDSSAISAMTANSSRVTVSFWAAGRNDRIHSIGFTMGIIKTIRILKIRPEEIVIFLQYNVPRVFGRISERRRIPRVRMAEAMATPYWPGFSAST